MVSTSFFQTETRLVISFLLKLDTRLSSRQNPIRYQVQRNIWTTYAHYVETGVLRGWQPLEHEFLGKAYWRARSLHDIMLVILHGKFHPSHGQLFR